MTAPDARPALMLCESQDGMVIDTVHFPHSGDTYVRIPDLVAWLMECGERSDDTVSREFAIALAAHVLSMGRLT